MIGILGGIFDPIHFGHLRIALDLYQNLPFEEIRFIPCGQPPHRGVSIATAEQRVAMLQIAINDQSGLSIDECELHRSGPSYMVDTLTSLRDELDNQPIGLIMGLDAFVQLESWHQWQKIIDLCHIIVVSRPGAGLELESSAQVAKMLEKHQINDPSVLVNQAAGHILIGPQTQLDISSSLIRDLIAADKSPRYLLPDDVLAYIKQQGLYHL